MVIGQQMKEEGHDKKLLIVFIFNFPFICYLSRICKCYESQVLNTHPLSKDKFLSVMLWSIVYLH